MAGVGRPGFVRACSTRPCAVRVDILDMRVDASRTRSAIVLASARAERLAMSPLDAAVLVAVELLGFAAEVVGVGLLGHDGFVLLVPPEDIVTPLVVDAGSFSPLVEAPGKRDFGEGCRYVWPNSEIDDDAAIYNSAAAVVETESERRCNDSEGGELAFGTCYVRCSVRYGR